MDKDISKLIKEIQKAGYDVKKVVKTKKHTFEVEEEQLKRFFDVAHARDMKIKDAMSEALGDWIKKRG